MDQTRGVNDTMIKFGYPAQLVCEYDHWVVLLRPAQATLGALVLASKESVTRFGQLSPAAFGEYERVIKDIEAALEAGLPMKKINYMMLMMVDPHVHCHVLPRYDGTEVFSGCEFLDKGWPGLPDLAYQPDVPVSVMKDLLDHLKRHWPAG